MRKSLLARNRIIYAFLTLGALWLGFASRRFLGDYAFIKMYVGDGLWALMIFLSFAFMFRQWSIRAVAIAALGFCVAIELSQLYHAPWIDRLRAIPLGGLILGFSFVWSDLLCYSLGVGAGVLIELYLLQPFTKSAVKPNSVSFRDNS